MSSRPTRSTWQAPGQSRLHSKTLSQKNKINNKAFGAERLERWLVSYMITAVLRGPTSISKHCCVAYSHTYTQIKIKISLKLNAEKTDVAGIYLQCQYLGARGRRICSSMRSFLKRKKKFF